MRSTRRTFRKAMTRVLALDLGLYTGQRKSDVVRMGKQHRKQGKIAVTPTEDPEPRSRDRSIRHRQSRSISVPKDGLTFLVTKDARAVHWQADFGHRFKLWCREAGIRGYSFHGLRKACCRRLAEAGCSAPEIMAISGHKSLAEVQRYIDAVNQERMGERAIARTNLSPIADPAFPKAEKL